MIWSDIVIFGIVALLILVNTIYGVGVGICWIWKKVKKWIFNIK